MNGAEILKKYYADYDSGHTVMLSEMIDAAMAEATNELRENGKRLATYNLNLLLDLSRLASGDKTVNDIPEIEAVKQQILERDSVIVSLDKCVVNKFSSRACEHGTKSCTVYHVVPSEALRQYTEQIKKEVQERCAVAFDDAYINYDAQISLGDAIRELKL
jgi:hypothetical protein